MQLEELLQRISRRSQKVDIAALTPELEDRFVSLAKLRRMRNRNLVISLHSLGKEDKFGRSG